jgi:hypothetical protein
MSLRSCDILTIAIVKQHSQFILWTGEHFLYLFINIFKNNYMSNIGITYIGITAFTPEKLRSDGDRLTCHVCSVPHSCAILVKRGRLGKISKMPLLPLRG